MWVADRWPKGPRSSAGNGPSVQNKTSALFALLMQKWWTVGKTTVSVTWCVEIDAREAGERERRVQALTTLIFINTRFAQWYYRTL